MTTKLLHPHVDYLICGKFRAEILLLHALQRLSPTYEITATGIVALEPTSGLANADVQRSTRKAVRNRIDFVRDIAK